MYLKHESRDELVNLNLEIATQQHINRRLPYYRESSSGVPQFAPKSKSLHLHRPQGLHTHINEIGDATNLTKKLTFFS